MESTKMNNAQPAQPNQSKQPRLLDGVRTTRSGRFHEGSGSDNSPANGRNEEDDGVSSIRNRHAAERVVLHAFFERRRFGRPQSARRTLGGRRPTSKTDP